MIRDFGLGPVYVAVVSAGRPHAIEPMTALVGLATWFVPEDAESAYAAAPAVVEARGLVGARNAALDVATAQGVPCVQVSDDLARIRSLGGDGKGHPIEFAAAVADMCIEAGRIDFGLLGVAPTDNPFYARYRVGHRHFIVGDLMLIKPGPLRFDPRFRLKEDYDFTCQHYARYGGVARLDWLLATFAHRKNPGGAVAVRTPELEQEMIALLKQKWGDWIGDNPRRPNEVLLRLPRR